MAEKLSYDELTDEQKSTCDDALRQVLLAIMDEPEIVEQTEQVSKLTAALIVKYVPADQVNEAMLEFNELTKQTVAIGTRIGLRAYPKTRAIQVNLD